mmetsp:Transcript_98234/g.311634  ORF Transcript_98234/g.311634 Transcript_98234/m.311634 type:complete len:483 (-) Transcript_98234:9-1457(-)
MLHLLAWVWLLLRVACGSPPLLSDAEVAQQRFNATFRGLEWYYWNASGGTWSCCGQNGGGGGVGRFGCACDRADGRDCLNCYRWWGAQVLQALVQQGSAQSAPDYLYALVSGLAETMLTQSPYNAAFGRGTSWAYVDDYLWYVLAFLSTYEWLKDERYLDMARETYGFLREYGWDAQCGGTYWIVNPRPVAAPARPEKNAVTNLEMLQAAAKLYLLTGEPRYAAEAKQMWDWFEAVPLRDPDGLLGDGLTGHAGSQSDCCNGTAALPSKPRCVRNGGPSYTYNQGLFVGSAGLMFRITGDRSYVREAQRTLRAVLRRMTAAGVLREPLGRTRPAREVVCDRSNDPAGGDLYSFKGVFVLQLAGFLRDVPVDEDLRGQLRDLVSRSSDAAWGLRTEPPWPRSPPDVCADPALAELTSGPPKFPWYWAYVGPSSSSSQRVCMDARTQISALSLFVAHALVASEAAASDGTALDAAPADRRDVFL